MILWIDLNVRFGCIQITYGCCTPHYRDISIKWVRRFFRGINIGFCACGKKVATSLHTDYQTLERTGMKHCLYK